MTLTLRPLYHCLLLADPVDLLHHLLPDSTHAIACINCSIGRFPGCSMNDARGWSSRGQVVELSGVKRQDVIVSLAEGRDE